MVFVVRNKDNFYKYCRTPEYIKFDGRTDSILNIDVNPSNSDKVYIFEYDDKLKYLGYTNNIYAISQEARYIKIMIENSAYYDCVPYISIGFKLSHQYKTVKNNDFEQTNNRIYFLSFDVTAPHIPFSSDESSEYLGKEQGRHFDNGFIILPPNYDERGEPVPLAIYVHGTNGYYFNEMSISLYKEYLNFVSLNGYAVVDCSGLSDLYGFNVDGTDNINCKISPISLSCFTSLYNFVLRNYNIRNDGCYIFGKSSGGLMTAWFSHNNVIPIRAAAGLAPSFNMVGSDIRYGCSSRAQVKFWLSLFGCDSIEENIADGVQPLSTTEMKYVVSQYEKFIGYDPIAIESNMDYKLLLDEMANIENETYNGLPRPIYKNYSQVTDIINSAFKMSKVPFKIWHAVDDDSVLIYTSEWFSDMTRRSGGLCLLRRFPENTGKHHAVDNAENAPKCSYKTKFGEEVEIPVAYAELVDWFNMW